MVKTPRKPQKKNSLQFVGNNALVDEMSYRPSGLASIYGHMVELGGPREQHENDDH